MNKKFDSVINVYKDLLHKINFLDVKHQYDINIKYSEEEFFIMITFSHKNNIVVLEHQMQINDFKVLIDFKTQNVHFSHKTYRTRNNFEQKLPINPFSKQFFYAYNKPIILVSPTFKEKENCLNFHQSLPDEVRTRNLSLSYKIEHSRKGIEARESQKIRIILHKLFNDYIDKDVRKLICYYKIIGDFYYYNKYFFERIVGVEYTRDNYFQFKERLFQILKTYPALFRASSVFNHAFYHNDINNSFYKAIFLGHSLKPFLKDIFNTLKSVKTPIIKPISNHEINLIHNGKLKYRDIKTFKLFNKILHDDYVSNRESFIEFRDLFLEHFKLDPKRKNYESKIINHVSEIRDTINFLNSILKSPQQFKFKKLVALNKRYHEIAHRLKIPEHNEHSSEEIVEIENSRRINFSDFEYSNSLRQLVTEKEFATEGYEMTHCVAGYYSSFMSKRDILFSINHEGNRSTAEYLLMENGKFKLVQNRREKNHEPAPMNKRIAYLFEKFLNSEIYNFYEQIKYAPFYRKKGTMKLNEELVIESLLKPFNLYKKSILFK